jgi:phosphatidylinositol alpha-1,6-mannosyltransferase
VSTPTLAAITLAETGGGVAAVSRLIWNVMGEGWTTRQLVTLDAHQPDARPRVRGRIKFGLELGSVQASHPDSWVLFSHLSLARAHAYLPTFVRRPYGVFLHGIEAWRPLGSLERGLLRGAAVRMANSRFTARQVMIANPGIGAIEVCPLAVPPAAASDSHTHDDRSSALDIGPQAVLLVGRLSAAERYKGHDALLEVWPEVAKARPDARLVFAGDGDDRPRLTQKAQALGIADRVIFCGFVSSGALSALYSRARLFAMPSRGEGFGLVYLEAMAHALPCIGSIHDAAGEIIEDGVTGFLVDQADGDALKIRLLALLGDEAACARMGAAGQRRVHDQFSYRGFSQRFVDLARQAFGAHEPALAGVRRTVNSDVA